MSRRSRLERKVQKRAEWAAKADARSDARLHAADRIASVIPLGQPILVGHHSEGRHRRDLERIDSNMRKGIEESKLADHHRSAGAGLADQLERSVFSDDDDAVQQLEARIAERVARVERCKAINRAIRSGGHVDPPLTAAEVAELASIAHAFGAAYKPGYPPYVFTNLSANLRRDRARITEIQQQQQRSRAAAEAPAGVLIEGNGYVRITFADKPPRATLDALKAAGFQWAGGGWVGERAKIPPEVLACQ